MRAPIFLRQTLSQELNCNTLRDIMLSLRWNICLVSNNDDGNLRDVEIYVLDYDIVVSVKLRSFFDKYPWKNINLLISPSQL